jgi:hypothetical protein
VNSTTNYQPYITLIGERPVVTDENENDVLEQLRTEIEQIKTEIGQAENKGLAEKLGFKKLSKNAIISVDSNPKNTSSIMNEIISPSHDLQEALKYALEAAPVGDLKDIVFDMGRNEKDQTQSRVGDALAARANVLSTADAPVEAQIVRENGGYSSLPLAERRIMQVNLVRTNGREVKQARLAIAGKAVG